MNTRKMLISIFIAPAIFVSSAPVAVAATVWTNWTAFSAGNPGNATGTLNSNTVNYSGELIGTTNVSGTTNIWNPDATYIGGTVDASPSTIGDVIGLDGSTTLSTLNFSSPITNPVIAIWSLGRPSVNASFTFNETPTLQVGGPNSIFGGSSLVVDGTNVSGNEGNGVILFEGEFDSISWTSTNEDWYGFTVGSVQPVPVPAAIWFLGSGLLGLGWLKKKSISSSVL